VYDIGVMFSVKNSGILSFANSKLVCVQNRNDGLGINARKIYQDPMKRHYSLQVAILAARNLWQTS
jgi:hypothetical protein